MTTRSVLPANELQEAHFRGAGVWRFVTPEEMEQFSVDESYVIAEADPPGIGQYGSYLIAARYDLQNGDTLPGVVDVGVVNGLVEFTPATVFAAGKSVDPLGRDTEIRLQRLLKKQDVQPTRWSLVRPLSGETEVRSGSIGRPGLSQALGLLAQLARLKLSR